MNIIQIAGHLGADPETRFTPSGQKVTSFRVAVNGRRAGKEETSWYRITVWGDRFDKMMPYLKKGSAVIIVGTLHKPEIYTDKEGRPQVSLDITAEMIQFSPFGKSEREGGAQQEGGQYNRTGYTQQQSTLQQNYPQQNYQQQQQAPAHDDYRFDQVGGLSNSNHNEEDIPF
ncbi:MAG: single-stranded DNA-binding protein [Parachlamydiales bacterium]|jgi:single-strand DNA-binding protein